jgi:hypothetical protein
LLAASDAEREGSERKAGIRADEDEILTGRKKGIVEVGRS